MKKMNILWYILNSVFIVVFLIFFFILSGIENSTAVWISFGFIIFSYSVLLCTPIIVEKGFAETDYRWPLLMISLIYFFLSFVTNLIIIIIGSNEYIFTVLANVLLIGIYAIFLLANLLANEHTAKQVKVKVGELRYVKNVSCRLKVLLNNVSDKTLEKKIGEAYDLISSSPAKSNSTVKELEEAIFREVLYIENCDLSTNSLKVVEALETIISLANQRNNILLLKS